MIQSKGKRGRISKPQIRVSETHSRCVQFRVSTALGLHGKNVKLEVDLPSLTLRLKESAGGRLVNKKMGMFGLTTLETKVIPKTCIPLELDSDGWWYGDFSGLFGKSKTKGGF